MTIDGLPRVHGYRLSQRLGAGGFATVYLARREAFDHNVAVKVVHVDGAPEQVRMRFERERRALGALTHHPNIVTVYDTGVTLDGAPYLAMEYLPAGSLESHVGTLTMPRVLEIGVRTAGALATAHRAGVLHRDVKPANILLSRYREPLLADFGIARLAGAGRTATGVVTASLLYAPPEVLDGQEPSAASDVYSLAATLVCLATGRTPFEPGGSAELSVGALVARVLHEPVPDLTGRGLAPPVARVLAEGLAKDAGERPRSAEEFARRLQRAQLTLGLPVTELLVEDTGTEGPRERPVAHRAPSTFVPAVPPAPPSAPIPLGRPAGPPPRAPRPPTPTPAPAGRRWVPALVIVAAALLVVIVLVALVTGTDRTGNTSAGGGAAPTPSTTVMSGTDAVEDGLPAGLAGTWSGSVVQTSRSTGAVESRYGISITVTAGSTATAVSYPDLGCSGRQDLRSRTNGGGAELVERIESGRERCVDEVSVTLEPEGTGLRYGFVSSGSRGDALLTRR